MIREILVSALVRDSKDSEDKEEKKQADNIIERVIKKNKETFDELAKV